MLCHLCGEMLGKSGFLHYSFESLNDGWKCPDLNISLLDPPGNPGIPKFGCRGFFLAHCRGFFLVY
jgi:hypothetical protein